MKNFIVNVSRYKKWITLGLSILYLLLFCFPLIAMGKFDNSTNEVIAYELPFILFLAQFVIYFPQDIKDLSQIEGEIHPITLRNFSISLTCSILMLATFILAIICLIRLFKGKKFNFVWSLAFGFLTMLVKGIPADTNIGYSFYPTTAIFLVLLILDVVYLILEKHYLKRNNDNTESID